MTVTRRWATVAMLALLVAVAPLAAAQGNAQQLFFDGFELFKAGKAKEAAAKFEQGLQSEPGNALARFYLGEAFLAMGQKGQAEVEFRKSLELDAKSLVAEQARRRLETSGKTLADRPAPPGKAAGTIFKDCDKCPEMVVLPPGEFVMGSPPSEPGSKDDERPPHMVTIPRSIAVSRYEVIFAEWDACFAERACAHIFDNGWGRERRPAIGVSFDQAINFVEWLSAKTKKQYRLLSESEWEYAARAGSQQSRYWGDGPGQACQYENLYDFTGSLMYTIDAGGPPFDCNDKFLHTAPVGSFKPNAFGLYDMLGNVSEWVADCWRANYDSGAPVDGAAYVSAGCSEHVMRGGNYIAGQNVSRSALRARLGLLGKEEVEWAMKLLVGFRVARSLP